MAAGTVCSGTCLATIDTRYLQVRPGGILSAASPCRHVARPKPHSRHSARATQASAHPQPTRSGRTNPARSHTLTCTPHSACTRAPPTAPTWQAAHKFQYKNCWGRACKRARPHAPTKFACRSSSVPHATLTPLESLSTRSLDHSFPSAPRTALYGCPHLASCSMSCSM